MNLTELLICRYLVINARDAMEISIVMHTFIDNTFIFIYYIYYCYFIYLVTTD